MRTCLEDCPVMLQCQEKARQEGWAYGVWGYEFEQSRRAYWNRVGGRPMSPYERMVYGNYGRGQFRLQNQAKVLGKQENVA